MNNYPLYADEIKNAVSMPEALRFYGFEFGRDKRIPCPLHRGKDRNFGFNEKTFHCFVCGASGDVIGFVEQYFGLSFKDAVAKLNEDFQLDLPIGRKMTLFEKRKTELKAEMRNLEEFKRMLDKKEAEAEYNEALAEWRKYEKMRKENEPKDKNEEFNDEWVKAVINLPRAEFRLEMAERGLSKIEHNG